MTDPTTPKCFNCSMQPDCDECVKKHALRARRRERLDIAARIMAGLLADTARSGPIEDYAEDAVLYADALIARVDKEMP